MITVPMLHIARYERLDIKGKSIVVLMSIMQFFITIGLLVSYIYSLKPIYGLLLF